MKYRVIIQTRKGQIVKSIFLIEKNDLIGFLKIIGVLQLPIRFSTISACNKILKVRYSCVWFYNLEFNILLQIRSEPKVIWKKVYIH